MKKQKKKGVAVIYDPHNLYQFIWYYCTYGQDYDWTALCLPNGYKGEYMSGYCEKSGIFHNIIRHDEAFLSMSWRKKVGFFLQMLIYAIVGQQEKYCAKLIKKYLPDTNYDLAVVLTDVGIVSGAFIGLSKKKKTVILEDGMGDYADRPKGYLLKHITNAYDWQGFFVAKMGYANPAHYYSLKTTRYCEKYSSNPDKMLYRNYKSIKRLFDLKKTDEALFQSITQKVYSEIEKCDFGKAETIVFTNRLYDFGENVDLYVKKFEEYVNKNCKSIIIKRHPRDETKYQFADHVCVQEIDNSVPAEVLLQFLKGKEILFMFTSSILLYMLAYGYEVSYLYFKGLYETNQKSNTYLKYMTKKEMVDYLKRFNLQDSSIIEI